LRAAGAARRRIIGDLALRCCCLRHSSSVVSKMRDAANHSIGPLEAMFPPEKMMLGATNAAACSGISMMVDMETRTVRTCSITAALGGSVSAAQRRSGRAISSSAGVGQHLLECGLWHAKELSDFNCGNVATFGGGIRCVSIEAEQLACLRHADDEATIATRGAFAQLAAL